MPAYEEAGRPGSRDVIKHMVLSIPGRNYKVFLIETLTLWNQTLKKIHVQTVSHTQMPPLFKQISIPYVLHCPQQWEAFHPSPGHSITMPPVGSLVPYNRDRGRTRWLVTGILHDG